MGGFFLGGGILRPARKVDLAPVAGGDRAGGAAVGGANLGTGMVCAGAGVSVRAGHLHTAAALLDRLDGARVLGGRLSAISRAALRGAGTPRCFPETVDDG